MMTTAIRRQQYLAMMGHSLQLLTASALMCVLLWRCQNRQFLCRRNHIPCGRGWVGAMHWNGVWRKWCCGQSVVGPFFLFFLLFNFVSPRKKWRGTYPLDPLLTTILVEEWTGQEWVEPQDGANSIDSFFLDFWIKEGDLPSQMRVFTITIGWVFAYPMDLAATAMLNKYPFKKMFRNLFLHLAVSFLHVFMYFPCQPQHPPVVHKLHPLLILRSPFIKSTSSLS